MNVHNFNAGPAILPQEALKAASAAVLDFNQLGMSILEISHRSKDFQAVIDEATASILTLLDLPSSYKVLFLQGGASTQFAMVPMNLLAAGEKAAYVNTGTWSKKAIKEAKLFGTVDVLASSEESTFNYIPKDYSIPADARYLHLTSNNTIYGTQLHTFPSSKIPVVVDMSSDIFSREMDYSQFDLIYAGAQKNLGPAGVTLVIIKDGLLRPHTTPIPSMFNYQTHIDAGSLYNTPPVFPIYMCMLTLRWLKEQGGLASMEQKNQQKATMLYDEIDRNPLFKGTVAVEDRSLMNVNFIMENKEWEAEFLQFAKEHQCIGLAGHRSVGGFRASIYNALPIDSVAYLVNLMQEFEQSKA